MDRRVAGVATRVDLVPAGRVALVAAVASVPVVALVLTALATVQLLDLSELSDLGILGMSVPREAVVIPVSQMFAVNALLTDPPVNWSVRLPVSSENNKTHKNCSL